MNNQQGFFRLIGIILGTLAVAIAIFFFTSIGSFALDEATSNTDYNNLAPFTKIEIKGSGTLLIKEGSSIAVSIESDTALLDKFLVDSKEGLLSIQMNELDNIRALKLSPETTTITITTPEIESLSISGSYKIDPSSKITGDKLGLSLTGKISGGAFLTTNQTSIDTSGQSTIELKGSAFDQIQLTSNGSGTINMSEVTTPQIDFQINGSLTVRTNNPKRANLELTGASKVFFESLPTDWFSARTAGQSVIEIYDANTSLEQDSDEN